jgi:hypothetical protein
MVCDLPRTQVFNYYRPEDPDESGGSRMEFRLIYDGPLPSEQCESGGKKGRAEYKQRLRKRFHLQLRELWKQDVALKNQASAYFTRASRSQIEREGYIYTDPDIVALRMSYESNPGAKRLIDWIADDHIRCNGNRFIPLVSIAGGFTCSLDILFLRRDNPGSLVESGGDIDNRIKVLLDGLRMPTDVKELGGIPINADEDPFYCLLEDDKLITSVSVTTDRLIVPQKEAESINDVVLVIHVKVVNPGAIFAGNRLI